METLIQIAKRLGIKPNPAMTDEEYLKIKELIVRELKTMGNTSEDSLDGIMYEFHKKTPSGIAQQFDERSLDKNILHFKTQKMPGVSYFVQGWSFLWHDARENGVGIPERFVADLKLDDPKMPEIFQKLDQFILRHRSGYKVTSHGNRTDTLNLYLSKSITPEIAKEFYDIVKPVLQTKNHEYLDGFPITQNGKEIQGIKFGPEPVPNVSLNDDFNPMKERLARIFSRKMIYDITKQYAGQKSLGEVSAKVQLCDLLYYLVGREGQNPIQLGNQFGDPNKKYNKKLDISGADFQRRVEANSQPKKNTASVSHQEALPTGMADLLKSLQSIRQQVHSIRSDVEQLRQSNAQLKQNVAGLHQENVLLRKQNNGY